MQRTLSLILWGLILQVLTGCALHAQFNPEYLPAAAADHPESKIVLTSQACRPIADYLRQTNVNNFIRLQWWAENEIYLYLEDSSIFLIEPQTHGIRRLDNDEERAAKQRLSRKVQVTLNQEGLSPIRQFTASLFNYGGHRFTGKLNDNGHTIEVDVKTAEERLDPDRSRCNDAKLKGRLKDEHNRITEIEWDFSCDWTAQPTAARKVPQLLSRLCVSPAGDYYLYGSRLYQAGKNKGTADLLGGYRHLLGIAINPSWTRIAVLRGRKEVFWVEFFPVSFDDHSPFPTKK